MEIQSRFYSLNLCGIQTSKRLTYQLGGNDFRYLIWIFWVCWLSPKWCNVDCSQLMSWFDRYQLQLVYPTREHGPGRNLQQETLQTSFDLFNQSQHLRHTREKSFLFWCFSCVYTFLEIIEHTIPQMLLLLFHLENWSGYTKFTNFDFFFLMHADMMAVTKQSNKVVLNEVKDD